MTEVKITYETLFDLLRREKTREELQELDKTFYSDVVAYMQAKQSLIDNKGSQAELFGASESEKIKLQIQNIKKIVKELYDRRVSKIMKLGMNRSKAGGGISNTVAMLPEEKTFFDETLLLLNKNREDILNQILFFEKLESRVSLKKDFVEAKKEFSKVKSASEEETNEEIDEDEGTSEEKDSKEQESDDDYDIKVSVRFKDKVPKFVGKKLETYGPFEEGDEAELPRIIAKILINKDKAEETQS